MPDYSSPGNFVGGITFDPSSGAPGSALSTGMGVTAGATAIVDSTATQVGLITVPNVACSWAGLVILRLGLTGASHTYDSTRVWVGTLAVTRVPGAAAVSTLTVVTGGSQQATSASGYTITITVALGSVSGGVTATNTFAINVTSVGSTASTSECQCMVIGSNGAAGGVLFS